MNKIIFILFVVLLSGTTAIAQEKYKVTYNHHGDTTETNDPDYYGYTVEDSITIIPTKWIPYTTKCKQCQPLAKQYNETMQELFNVRGLLLRWENLRSYNERRLEDEKKAKKAMAEAMAEVNANLKNVTELPPEPLSEKEAARAFRSAMNAGELYENKIPRLREVKNKLELTAKNLRKALTQCEMKCVPPKDRKDIVSLPSNDFTPDPELPFDWNGPYYEVCEACRKLASHLNDLYKIGIDNVNELNTVNAKLEYLKANLWVLELHSPTDKKKKKRLIKAIKKQKGDIKKAQKEQKRILKNQKKIIKNFNDTLAKYQKCIKKCPVQKKACIFPDDLFEEMTIGPNNEVGSSAQAAKELRDKATGAVKGAATKALGNLIGFNLGGGGKSGPKMDKDRSRGKFTRISAGDTILDMRASWRKNQLIVSTKIEDTPGKGTFHAQWLKDKQGKTYLPARYMIFNMYRDWKLTVSWTEDHYVNGEHVFHDEGREITTGRDHLGTWSLFDKAKGLTNSIWSMLGFDTAAKGVKHLGAIYDIPKDSFPEECQMQLITHISQPDKDPVITKPVVGNLFKHVDNSKRKPKTIVLIQPHIIDDKKE